MTITLSMNARCQITLAEVLYCISRAKCHFLFASHSHQFRSIRPNHNVHALRILSASATITHQQLRILDVMILGGVSILCLYKNAVSSAAW
jgi:hypothetical protein